jgi:hypothetical protein
MTGITGVGVLIQCPPPTTTSKRKHEEIPSVADSSRNATVHSQADLAKSVNFQGKIRLLDAKQAYGWIGQQPSSGFCDLAPSILHYSWF